MRFPGLLSLLLATKVLCDLTPFDEWKHLRVALEDVSIHVRYHGTGPPVLLVHGFPQNSLTWHTIGPILAQNYTVLAVDLRGCGSSSIPRDGDYTAETVSTDLLGVLNFLKINQTPLPGTGIYEAFSNPSPSWNTYSNWQLAFFSIPDIAQYFIQGREKEMLAWYFFHGSYAGNSAISQDHLDRYTTEISKPGFLRSGFSYFATTGVDGTFFNASIRGDKLTQPVLALGGETSVSPLSLVQEGMGVVGFNSSNELIPKAGHWIADENPEWVARRLQQFLGEDQGIPSVDLSYLADLVTIPQQLALGATIG